MFRCFTFTTLFFSVPWVSVATTTATTHSPPITSDLAGRVPQDAQLGIFFAHA